MGLAKQIVLTAHKSSAHEALLALDRRLDELTAVVGPRGFPAPLVDLPTRLYLLRRSALLTPGRSMHSLLVVQHPDDILALRLLFLTGPSTTCLGMIPNRLDIFREQQRLSYLPLDIALQSELCLVLDVWTEIFVWYGRSAERLLPAALTYVKSITSNRFPAPYVKSFKEGSSMARYLQVLPSQPGPLDSGTQRPTRMVSETFSDSGRTLSRAVPRVVAKILPN